MYFFIIIFVLIVKTCNWLRVYFRFTVTFCNFNLSRSFWCFLPRTKNVRSKMKIVLKKTSDSCRYVCPLGSFQQSVQNTDNKSAKSLISNSVEPSMRKTKPSRKDFIGFFSVEYLWFQVMFYIMAWLHCHFEKTILCSLNQLSILTVVYLWFLFFDFV